MIPRRVLVLGSGGREHALAWRLSVDSPAPLVIVAPGNPGIAARFECVPLDPGDAAAVIRLCRERGIELVVVGPEAPLATGIVDAVSAAGYTVFGPSRAAAQLESSKWFAKTVLAEAGAPTARAVRCTDVEGARTALADFPLPWVLKADGLAAGKGVLVTSDRAAAEEFIDACLMGQAFGASGQVMVIEEPLEGSEATVMAVCDGERFLLLPAAHDFKRAFEDDRGPNTGGMGAWAPHPSLDAGLENEIGERIIAPVLGRMAARGTPFRGVLYAGLMLTSEGPRVIEFNVRFGDPEAQVVLPLVEGSLAGLLDSAARGALDAQSIRRAEGAAVAVALTDAGYPGTTSGTAVITGLEACEAREGVQVFHAATVRADSAWRVSGGRAAYVTARGENLGDARSRARAAVACLGGNGWRYRSDVAGATVDAPGIHDHPGGSIDRPGTPGTSDESSKRTASRDARMPVANGG
ncbi:MAG: phosphoribosylamine--glycine ligase [Candidatus Eisenbacteria bacterium]